MARLIASKISKLALCIVVFVFSLIVGTVLSALLVKASEL
jgi:hypothetical protein